MGLNQSLSRTKEPQDFQRWLRREKISRLCGLDGLADEIRAYVDDSLDEAIAEMEGIK